MHVNSYRDNNYKGLMTYIIIKSNNNVSVKRQIYEEFSVMHLNNNGDIIKEDWRAIKFVL